MFGIEVSIGASYLAMSDIAVACLCVVMVAAVVAWFQTIKEEE